MAEVRAWREGDRGVGGAKPGAFSRSCCCEWGVRGRCRVRGWLAPASGRVWTSQVRKKTVVQGREGARREDPRACTSLLYTAHEFKDLDAD